MKVGTKFKLECVVVEDNNFYGGSCIRPAGSMLPLCATQSLSEKAASAISDVRPPPRRRIVDPVDGYTYEILEKGDTWEVGDIAHERSTGTRNTARNHGLIGASVLTGDGFLVGLRPVKQ